MDELWKVIVPVVTAPTAIVILLLFFPDKIEKWSSLLWKLLRNAKLIYDFANRRYIKHDLQSRINEFVSRMGRIVPNLETNRIALEWVEGKVDKSSFLRDGKVILRLRQNDPKDENFVHGAYHFVATSLLYKVKRYITLTQKECLDLYVTAELLRDEKPGILGYYLDEYIHPKLADAKRLKYYDKYDKINKGGYFYPVYIHELDFLGNRVFGKRRDDLIHSEVDALIDFLLKVSSRKIGDESDLDFSQGYCKFGIMIIGKPSKIHSIDPYVSFVRNHLVSQRINSVYLIAVKDNKEKVDQICAQLKDAFDVVHTGLSSALLSYPNGQELRRSQYYAVLRRVGLDFYQAS